MGHIVFGAPPLDSGHLHDRLQRALAQRGHRVTWLCPDAEEAMTWRHCGVEVATLRRDAVDEIPEPALLDGLDSRRQRQRQQRYAAVTAWAAANPFDLLFLHARRGGESALLQFVARRHGRAVLWTGPGLLPHTMQCDERGLDGDAAASHRSAHEFRCVRAEPELLRACLCHALAGTRPFGLPRRTPCAPSSWPQRCRQQLERRLRWFAARWAGHDQLPGEPVPPVLDPAGWQPPTSPFLGVLLQAPDDPRIVHDSEAGPDAARLCAASVAAAQRIDPALQVVVVAPPGQRRQQDAGNALVHAAPAGAAALVAATATAVVTVNHPLASIGLLAGTPVLHLGTALYGLPGAAWRTSTAALPATLARALRHDYPTLRERFATWLFGHGHLWCSATEPDHNGLLGLVAAIERRLPRTADRLAPLPYRSGPAWPLAAARRPQ
jgi:hypothetical protein